MFSSSGTSLFAPMAGCSIIVVPIECPERCPSEKPCLAETFDRHGFSVGHLSGHSSGTTMIEHPAIGANCDVAHEQNRICSLHPPSYGQEASVCLFSLY